MHVFSVDIECLSIAGLVEGLLVVEIEIAPVVEPPLLDVFVILSPVEISHCTDKESKSKAHFFDPTPYMCC